MTRELATPKTLHIGTWNALRDRPDKRVRGDVRALLRDHPNLHALAVQEALDYHDVLGNVDGYRLMAKVATPAQQQNCWLVREDVAASDTATIDLGGDGWTTVTGHHHPGDVALAVTIAGWLRAVVIHLPPSINWPPPERVPVGPPERVDDYRRAMARLLQYRRRRPDARGRLVNVRQQGRYGSDHPMVRFTVRRVGGHDGLLYVGDWNNKPGRDDGLCSVSWLATQGNMRIGRATNLNGHLNGVDLPLLARRLAA